MIIRSKKTKLEQVIPAVQWTAMKLSGDARLFTVVQWDDDAPPKPEVMKVQEVHEFIVKQTKATKKKKKKPTK